MVDYKEHRTPGQRRLWDVSSLEVIVKVDGEDAWGAVREVWRGGSWGIFAPGVLNIQINVDTPGSSHRWL